MNTGGTWKVERFEVVGFGRRFGTSPLGGRASGWHLGSVPYAISAPPAVLVAWAAAAISGSGWVVVSGS